MERPAFDFDWNNKGAPVSYTIGGNTYPPNRQVDGIARTSDSRYAAYTLAKGVAITFTPTVILPRGLSIIEYRWDFGDGTVSYGSPVVHTYTAASPQTAVELRLTDSLRRTYRRIKSLNLR